MSSKVDIKNKKAKFEYEFVETFTAGIQLFGTEINLLEIIKLAFQKLTLLWLKTNFL